MDPHELKAALAKLSLTTRAAAELFCHDKRAVERWVYGERRPPQGIVILLYLLLDKKVTIEDVAEAAAKI